MAVLVDCYSAKKYELHSNLSTKIELEINLVKNVRFDFCIDRDDYLNWIPFEFRLKVGECEVYEYPKELGVTLNLAELKQFFKSMDDLFCKIEERIDSGENSFEETREVKFFAMETYFGLDFVDAFDGLIGVTVWVRMASLPQHTEGGFDRGIRYTATLTNVQLFVSRLRHQLELLISSSIQ